MFALKLSGIQILSSFYYITINIYLIIVKLDPNYFLKKLGNFVLGDLLVNVIYLLFLYFQNGMMNIFCTLNLKNDTKINITQMQSE